MAQPQQMSQVLEMVRGDTKEWTFAVVDGFGAPVDLTSITSAYFTAKQSIADADPGVFQLVIGSGITIDSGSGGTGTVKASPSNTVGLPDARQVLAFDLEIKIGGNTYTPAAGQLIVYPDVTRT